MLGVVRQILGRRRRLRSQRALILSSGLFDQAWYREQYSIPSGTDPVVHYVTTGWRSGFSPGPEFDSAYYLAANPDIRRADVEPLEHYLRYGRAEGRRRLPPQSEGDIEHGLAARGGMDAHALASEESRAANSIQEQLEDPFAALLVREAQEASVLEVGFHGVSSLERVVLSLASGAKASRIMSAPRPAAVTTRLTRVSERLRSKAAIEPLLRHYPAADISEPWRPVWTEYAGRHWFVEGYIDERDLKNKLGPVDLVVSESSIFHQYEIIGYLRRLAYITERRVILSSMIVQPFEVEVDGRIVRFLSEDVWFAGNMTQLQTRALAKYWGDRGVNLDQLSIFPEGFTPSDVENAGLSGVWWWFFGMGGLKSLLEMAGLKAIAWRSLWDQRAVAVVAELTG